MHGLAPRGQTVLFVRNVGERRYGMDKLWKLAVVGLLGFLIGQLPWLRPALTAPVYLTNAAGTKRRQGDV